MVKTVNFMFYHNKKRITVDTSILLILSNALCYVKETDSKAIYCMIPFIEHSRKGKTTERKWTSGFQVLGLGQVIPSRGVREIFWDDRAVSYPGCGVIQLMQSLKPKELHN